jgi:hypothetical protein
MLIQSSHFSHFIPITERVGVAVVLLTCIREDPGLILGWISAILTEVLRGFPKYIQENARRVLQLGHECFLPNPSQIIIHLSTIHSTESTVATHSAVKRRQIGELILIITK